MLYYLIYMSRPTHFMGEEELDALLSVAKKNNERTGVTGMLVFIDEQNEVNEYGRFIQVLEGPEDAVKQLYQTIAKDERHNQITELFSYRIKQRNFPNWSMGFKRISDANTLPAGFDNWFDPDNFPESMNKDGVNIPLTYLRSFYDTHK